jgi:hypothetical protein
MATARRMPWIRRTAGILIVAMGIAGLARVPSAADLLAAAWACLHP